MKNLIIVLGLILQMNMVIQAQPSQCYETYQHDGWLAVGEPDALWIENTGVVTQYYNTIAPTFFWSPFIVPYGNYSFLMHTSSFENDWGGFAIGTNPLSYDHNYQLLFFDWKQETQGFSDCLNSYAMYEGMYLTSVSGIFDQVLCEPGSWRSVFWRHLAQPGVQVLYENIGGGTGWADNTTYLFEIVYEHDHITISIDGTLIVDQPNFNQPGRFSYYANSEEEISFSAFGYTPTTFFTSSLSEACAGSTVDFEIPHLSDLDLGLYNQAVDQIIWDFGDGTVEVHQDIDFSSFSPAHTYNVPGDYVVVQTLIDQQGCEATFSVPLTIHPLPSISDIALEPNCEGTADGSISITVQGGSPPFQYYWSPYGPDSPVNAGLNGGNYEVLVTDQNNCSVLTSIDLPTFPRPEYEIMLKHITCFGEADGWFECYPIDGSDLAYSLNGGAWQPIGYFDGLIEGTYVLDIRDNLSNCEYQEVLEIWEPDPLVLELPEDTLLQLGQSLDIHPLVAGGIGPLLFAWASTIGGYCSDCSSQTGWVPLQSGVVELLLTDQNGCSLTDQMLIEVEKNYEVYLPNIFHPNGHESNRRFLPGLGPDVSRISLLQIFDRWGNLVFEEHNIPNSDPSFGWDGTYKGAKMDAAVFVFYAVVEFIDGTSHPFSGDVTLVR